MPTKQVVQQPLVSRCDGFCPFRTCQMVGAHMHAASALAQVGAVPALAMHSPNCQHLECIWFPACMHVLMRQLNGSLTKCSCNPTGMLAMQALHQLAKRSLWSMSGTTTVVSSVTIASLCKHVAKTLGRCVAFASKPEATGLSQHQLQRIAPEKCVQ